MVYLWLVLGVAVLAFVGWLLRLVVFRPTNIHHFFERVMFRFALSNPELLSSLRVLEGFGIQRHNRKLNDESERFKTKQAAYIKRQLNILRSYDRERLPATARISRDILEWFLDDALQGDTYRHHDYPVNQLFGIQNGFPTFMVSTHHLASLRDAKNYILRLASVKRKFEQVLAGLQIREQKGVLPPRFVFDRVLEEMEAFVALSAKENILCTHMRDKLETIPGSAKDKQELLQRTAEEVQVSVYPAYQLLIDFFRQRQSQATTEDGIWKLPDGAAYYQYLLEHYTTTSLTPEQIHSIGLAEVERIHTQMTQTLTDLGYTGKHPIAHMKDISNEERFRYAESDESRRQVLGDYQEIIDRMQLQLEPFFDRRPMAKVVVKRVPQFKEKTAPGAYYERPPMDGSRPGTFYVNLLKLPKRYDMETLAYHEAIPGHHFQLAIQQELTGLPTFRKVIPFYAYCEGWALYAEKLAYEQGLFSDPFSELGYLSSELFRAVRLVVDSGLHYKRWTREQAIDYLLANTGADDTWSQIEVERYIVLPAQATAYKVGELEIVRLRNLARERLGENFDIKELHNVVLNSGAVPLGVLQQQVEAYIARKNSRNFGGN